MAYADPPRLTVLISDIFGFRNLGAIMGAITCGWAMGSAIGPALGGSVFDLTGSYSLAFLTASCGMVIATVLSTLLNPEKAEAKSHAPAIGE